MQGIPILPTCGNGHEHHQTIPINDVRSSYLSSEYIHMHTDGLENPKSTNPLSQIPNDSLALQFIPRSSRTALIIPSIDEFKIQNDYFVGLIFGMKQTNSLQM